MKATKKTAAAATTTTPAAPAPAYTAKMLDKIAMQVGEVLKGKPRTKWDTPTRALLAAWAAWCDLRDAIDGALEEFASNAPGVSIRISGIDCSAGRVRSALHGEDTVIAKGLRSSDLS